MATNNIFQSQATITPVLGQQAVKIRWAYNQLQPPLVGVDPSGNTPFNAILIDPAGAQRAPANTNTVTAATFVPAKDTDGTFYATVNFDASAGGAGVWYIESRYAFASEQNTIRVGFTVVATASGQTAPPGANILPQLTRYCTTGDVQRFVYRNIQVFDKNTVLSIDDVNSAIAVAMARIDSYTQRSWRPNIVQGELLDVTYSDKWRWHGDYICHVQTRQFPLQSILRLLVIQGGQEIDITASGPDRQGAWYTHDRSGSIFLVATNIPSILRLGVKVDYQWGEVSVPDDIRGACYRLAAAEIIQSEFFSVSLPEVSSNPAILESLTNRWTEDAYRLMDYNRDLVYATGGG